MRPRSCSSGRGHLAGQHGAARQADLAHAVDADDHHVDLVAEADHVFDMLDAVVGQFADADQAVLARQDLHERAVGLDADDLAQVDLADLDFLGQPSIIWMAPLGALAVGGGDEDRAVVLDVDLAAGLLGDAADGLAAGADQRADLLRVDL